MHKSGEKNFFAWAADVTLRDGRHPSRPSGRSQVTSLADFFDQSAIKRRKVIGFAARQEVLIDDHLFVNPVRSGIFQVGLNRLIGSQSESLGDSRVDQGPWTMADCGDQLS